MLICIITELYAGVREERLPSVVWVLGDWNYYTTNIASTHTIGTQNTSDNASQSTAGRNRSGILRRG